MERAVEILKDGLTAQGKVYLAGDIEEKPQEVLIACAEKGVTVRFVRVNFDKKQALKDELKTPEQPKESKEKPKKKGFLARILRK